MKKAYHWILTALAVIGMPPDYDYYTKHRELFMTHISVWIPTALIVIALIWGVGGIILNSFKKSKNGESVQGSEVQDLIKSAEVLKRTSLLQLSLPEVVREVLNNIQKLPDLEKVFKGDNEILISIYNDLDSILKSNNSNYLDYEQYQTKAIELKNILIKRLAPFEHHKPVNKNKTSKFISDSQRFRAAFNGALAYLDKTLSRG